MEATFRHYEMTNESMVYNGHTLYRIKSRSNFFVDRTFVKAGMLGGWIEKYDNLSDMAWVDNEAKVFGDAKVSGNALIKDCAVVCDNAQVCNDSIVGSFANISGHAIVDMRYGGNITNKAKISGNAEIKGTPFIGGRAKIRDNARIFDDVRIKGDTIITDNAVICGISTVMGNAHIGGKSHISGYSLITDKVKVKNATLMSCTIKKDTIIAFDNNYVSLNKANINSNDDVFFFMRKESSRIYTYVRSMGLVFTGETSSCSLDTFIQNHKDDYYYWGIIQYIKALSDVK